MKQIFFALLLLTFITAVSCGQAEETLEHKSELDEEQGIYRSVKYYNNNGTLLFSKTFRCSMQRNHDDDSGIVDIMLLDMDTGNVVDIQGNGTLIMEEVPQPGANSQKQN